MPAQTPSGWPYVVPEDHPLTAPAEHSQVLAQLLEARVGLKIAQAVKPAPSTGLASGAAAGFAATLSGLRVGVPVLAFVQSIHYTASGSATEATLTPAGLVGATVVSAPTGRHAISANSIRYNATAMWLLTATAATVTLGYAVTISNAVNWAAEAQSAITLIAHA